MVASRPAGPPRLAAAPTRGMTRLAAAPTRGTTGVKLPVWPGVLL
jgi:hypothetical protein